jgi:hypothetical protein
MTEIAELVERLTFAFKLNEGLRAKVRESHWYLYGQAATALEKMACGLGDTPPPHTPQGEIGMDIAERLRDSAVCSDEQAFTLLHDAADRIEHAASGGATPQGGEETAAEKRIELEARIERLEGALREIADLQELNTNSHARRIARAALKEGT